MAWPRRRQPASPLSGYVDEPRPAEVLEAGTVTVRGWHLWNGRPVLAVAVSTGGTIIGRAASGTEYREDVALALQDDLGAGAGWQLTVLLDGPPGPRELIIHVWPSLSAAPIALPPLQIMLTERVCTGEPRTSNLQESDSSLPSSRDTEAQAIDEVFGVLDTPAEDAVVDRGVLQVSGWAMDEQASASRVQISIDGRPYRNLRLGMPRPDMAMHSSRPHAGVCGFVDLIDLSELPSTAQQVLLEVHARDQSGQMHAVSSRTVQLRALHVEPEESTAQDPGPVIAALNKLASNAGSSSIDELNLVVFTHQLDFGGGQLWLSTLLEQCGAGRDFRCTVLTPTDGPLRASLEQLGIDVHIAAAAPLDSAAGYQARVAELAIVVRALGATAVLVNTAGAFVGVSVASACDLPAVWAIHESYSPEVFLATAYPKDHLAAPVKQSLQRAFQQAAALVFEAEQTRQLYLSAARPERCVVIPYGVETTQISQYCEQVSVSAARARLGLPDAARVIVVVGTAEPRKAQTVIAQAFAKIAEDYPDVVLAIVGRQPGLYGDSIETYLSERGLSDRVVLVPVVSDIYPWYRCADLLLCASDVESLPRSVLEAMSFEVPILATAVFGLPELITDGETGFLFEPRDIDALIEAMRRVLELDASRLRQVGAAGRQHVLAHYDAAGYAADIRSLLEELSRDALAVPGTLSIQR